MGILRKAVGPLPRIEHGTSITDTDFFTFIQKSLLRNLLSFFQLRNFSTLRHTEFHYSCEDVPPLDRILKHAKCAVCCFIVQPCIDKNIINSNKHMHIFIKNTLKSYKIHFTPTCFGSYKIHLQGAIIIS